MGKRKELYSRAIRQWGVVSQLLQCAEEASELSVAAIKVANRGTKWDNLAEECADVSIMLHQIKEALGDEFAARVKQVKSEKLVRLEKRLDDAARA